MHPHAVVFSRIEERIRNMAPLRIETYVVGPVQTNCYFAVNEDTDEVIVIDPGASARQLAAKVKEEGLKPAAILLTHGHFDHATGAGKLSELLGVKVYAFEKEKETLENPQLNLSGWQGSSLIYHADCFLKDERELDPCAFYTGTYGGRMLLLFPLPECCIQRGYLISDIRGKNRLPEGKHVRSCERNPHEAYAASG